MYNNNYTKWAEGMDKATKDTPFDVVIMSRQLGASLKIARKRRGLTQDEVARRIGATRFVILNAEKGESVTSHHLFSMLWLYGLLGQMLESLSDSKDVIGMSYEKSRLPQRVRKQGHQDEF